MKMANKDDKNFLYGFNWSVEYPELREAIDREMDIMLESTQYIDANKVINQIKENVKNQRPNS